MSRCREDHSAFIISSLRSLGKRTKKAKGNEILVQCLNPSHKDEHPSMSVRADGVFKCQSCGYKGNWWALVQRFGLPPLPGSDQKQDVVTATHTRTQALNDNKPSLKSVLNMGAKMPTNLKPWPGGEFRGFSEKTLKRLDTKLWMDYGIQRIFWPFCMKGKTLGGAGRVHPEWEPKRTVDEDDATYKARLKEWYRDGHPKYKNVFGVSAKKILYPYDIYGLINVVVLVEGQTSAIRLIDAGIDTMAILGSENWDDGKRGAITAKGVQHAILLFDGDDAGRRVTDVVEKALRSDSAVLSVHPIYLPEGVDPGDMDDAWLKFVLRKFLKLAGRKSA